MKSVGVCNVREQNLTDKSSNRKCSIKEAVLKNFAIFTGKHVCCSFFFIEFQAYRTVIFPVNIAKYLKTSANSCFCTNQYGISLALRRTFFTFTQQRLLKIRTWNIAIKHDKIPFSCTLFCWFSDKKWWSLTLYIINDSGIIAWVIETTWINTSTFWKDLGAMPY